LEEKSKNNKPLVSVFCAVFNQDKHISQCLDGFIMQETNFDFEVIVQDDASTDNTAKIISDYAKQYDYIVPVFHKINKYARGENINEYFFNNAKGKYLAFCEGDDYWTDPYKLQKQVDFLEANPDYSICFHDILILKDEKLVDEFIIKREKKDTYTIQDFEKGNFIYTPSVMYKHNPDVFNLIKNINKDIIGDFIVHIAYANFGKIKRLDEKMAVYRFGSGLWSTQAENLEKKRIMFNTIRMAAFMLNPRHHFLDIWYKQLIEKSEQIRNSNCRIDYDFENYLINTLDYHKLASKISLRELILILLLKIKNKIKR
jgi:glycosyltransferase involved in cell wall biosynthesis